MINGIKAIAEQKGCRLEVVPVGRIGLMQQDLMKLRKEPNLEDKLKKRIYNSSRVKGIPAEARSVVIIAVRSRAAYATYVFRRNGAEQRFFGPVGAPMEEARRHIMQAVADAGYAVFSGASSLPLKRFAVQSGLAEYGRDNITYV